MRIIALATKKGGVGKTTTATCLAVGLAKLGKSVLLIDMDPQGNAGVPFGVNKEDTIGKNIAQVLNGEMGLQDVVINVAENLYLIPASDDLEPMIEKIASERSREIRLKRAIAAADVQTDYIIIDCPPSVGLLNDNCFLAASEVFAPVQMEAFAAGGFGDLMVKIKDYRIDNPDLDLTGVLITMVHPNQKQSKELINELREGPFKDLVFKTEIPRTVRVSESQLAGKILYDYEPGNKASIAYMNFCKEVLAQG